MSYWAITKVLAGLEALEQNLFQCLFQLLEVVHMPWIVVPPCISKVSNIVSF